MGRGKGSRIFPFHISNGVLFLFCRSCSLQASVSTVTDSAMPSWRLAAHDDFEAHNERRKVHLRK